MTTLIDQIGEIVGRITLGNTTTVDRDTVLSDIGVDSMDMVELVMSLENIFGIQFDDADFLSFTRVGDILDCLKEKHNIQE